MTARIYNFGAGPAMLPEPILKEAQAEFLDWQNRGISILELGHRTPEFVSLLNHAEHTLRHLLSIPANYQVLFLGGAARTQFASIPMNLLPAGAEAAYLVTGVWSQMALVEAQRLKSAYCVGKDPHFLSVPERKTWTLKENSQYLYYTPNETVNGIRVPWVPKIKDLPLIADMTSCLLSEPININDYGLIFAGAQKNIANAGLTLVIIRNDLLERIPDPVIPSMLDYRVQVQHHSLYATPPVFNCYLAAKMFDWLKAKGGVDAIFQQNCQKAAKLYQYLDASDFYQTKVHPEARSIVNVCFSLKNADLESQFIEQAEQHGLYALRGHRMVGGLRASLYNAMPVDGVDALIEFMSQFARKYSK